MAENTNVVDELEALINGDFEVVANDEDTDLAEAESEQTDTNYQIDGEGEDTGTELTEDAGENTLVDDDDLTESEAVADEADMDVVDEYGSGEAGEDGDTAEDDVEGQSTETGSDDGKDTEDQGDVSESENTETVDYQKAFEELEEKSKVAMDFYDKVAGVEFKANGKMVKGFDDPEKLKQAQQLAYNYGAKMAGFKQYRPFMKPLKDRDILEHPEKFDLAMSIIDGDKEALKQHIKDNGIDPYELDMEDIKYEATPSRTSADMLAIEDALDAAKMQGVEEQVYNAVVKEWDDDSFKEFIDKPAVQQDLIQHMNNGTYDLVMGKVEQMGALDAAFAGQKMTDKYRYAIQELNREHAMKSETQQVEQSQQNVEKGTDPFAKERKALEAEREALKVEAAKIEKSRIAADKARKNKAAETARNKGAAVSQTKGTITQKKKIVDPLSELDGKGMASLLDSMIMGTNK